MMSVTLYLETHAFAGESRVVIVLFKCHAYFLFITLFKADQGFLEGMVKVIAADPEEEIRRLYPLEGLVVLKTLIVQHREVVLAHRPGRVNGCELALALSDTFDLFRYRLFIQCELLFFHFNTQVIVNAELGPNFHKRGVLEILTLFQGLLFQHRDAPGEMSLTRLLPGGGCRL